MPDFVMATIGVITVFAAAFALARLAKGAHLWHRRDDSVAR
jgi:hypothetical protein